MSHCRYCVFRYLALLLVLLCGPLHAQDGVVFSARIIETDPTGNTILRAREPFYVRIAYESSIPLRFQAAGFFDGAEIKRGAAMNPAPAYAPGKGEAVAWIAYHDPAAIDEVQLQIWDDRWEKLHTLAYPVSVRWNAATPAAWRQPVEWAARLSGEQQTMRSYGQTAGQSDAGDWGGALIMLAGWSIPGYFALQIYMLLRYRGGWRKAALLPLWGMIPLLGYTVFALLAGSNLWPLMLIFLTPLAFIYLVCVWLAKRFQHSQAS